MVVGVARLRLSIAGAASLKDKRRCLRSLKDRLRNMNLAVAEVADQDKWQLASLGLAVVSNDSAKVNAMLDQVSGLLAQYPELELLETEMEIIQL
ncbi:MAG: hypothetical protein BWY87_01290 [Deltaproteobacteria bacterium ADurb.Bin510]|nr:MAG: hypothetical protein BWY87_01290 [Deltaproteobacteria bacterium ADurb.Bin510]